MTANITWRPQTRRRLYYISALVLGLTLLVSSPSSAIATVCTGSGAGCTGTRSCIASITVPGLNSTFIIDVAGPAFASVSQTSDHERLELTWVLSNFIGVHPILGDINISLSPFITSTGIVEPLSPDQSQFFPALNTNNLFFRYEFSGLGIPSLLSSDPVTIQATINSIPPDGAVYNLIRSRSSIYRGRPIPGYCRHYHLSRNTFYRDRPCTRIDFSLSCSRTCPRRSSSSPPPLAPIWPTSRGS